MLAYKKIPLQRHQRLDLMFRLEKIALQFIFIINIYIKIIYIKKTNFIF